MDTETSTKNPDVRSYRVELDSDLRFLTPDQILMIDDMLNDVTPFGEITLKVKDGKLTFAAESKSYDALKFQRPSALEEELNNDK